MDYPLTSAQKTFSAFFDKAAFAVNRLSFYLLLPKRYSRQALHAGVNELTRCTDATRLQITSEQRNIRQRFVPYAHTEIPYREFRNLAELEAFANSCVNSPSYDTGSLSSAVLCDLPDRSAVLFISHHLVYDGFCIPLLSERLYRIMEHIPLEPSPGSFEAHLANYRDISQSKRFRRSRDFWNQSLQPAPVTNLFADQSSDTDYSCENPVYPVPDLLAHEIHRFCTAHNVMPAAFWYALFAIYFFRSKYFSCFSLGMPVLNRTTQEERNTAGMFVHILPLIFQMSDQPFHRFLLETENRILDLLRYQSFTQTDILTYCDLPAAQPFRLFDSVVDYQRIVCPEGCSYAPVYTNQLSVSLEAHVNDRDDGSIDLTLRYRTRCLSRAQIDMLFEGLCLIAEQALAAPETALTCLPIYPQAMIQSCQTAMTGTTVPLYGGRSVPSIFSKVVQMHPGEAAVLFQEERITYRELDIASNRIANALIESGIRKGQTVAFQLRRTPKIFAVMLGILKAGAAFLAIDPETIPTRIAFMLENSDAAMCIDDTTADHFLLHADAAAPNVSIQADDICYHVYTSGSTGNPKGVAITHKNIQNFVSAEPGSILHRNISRDVQVFLNLTTVSFDIFVLESLLPLCNGKTVLLADEDQSRIQSKLSALLQKHPADLIQLTPSKMRLLTANPNDRTWLRSLKTIILGGEVVDRPLVDLLRPCTDAVFINAYGPSEATVWATTDIIDDGPISIGKPLANTTVYLLDAFMQPLPAGIVGEICIAGACVGQGYLHAPAAVSFLPNPFGEGLLYKTGDLAYVNEAGKLMFVGRNDHQVKIHGQRVELGEIEHALVSLPEISQAAVTVRYDNADRQCLCAFYTAQTSMDAAVLRAALSTRLPRHMIPHTFIRLAEMPLNPHGKIDRKALPEVDLSKLGAEVLYLPPETPEEAALVRALEAVFFTKEISMCDSFLNMGGDSLQAIQLLSELEALGYSLTVRQILEAESFTALSKMLTASKGGTVLPPAEDTVPLSFTQEQIFRAYLLNKDSTVFNLPYFFRADSIDRERLETALQEILRRHPSLRTHFTQTPDAVMQTVDDTLTFSLEVYETEDFTGFVRPFDLHRDPLLRAAVCGNTAVMDVHHIAADGVSIGHIFRELNALYTGKAFPPESLPYLSFAALPRTGSSSRQYWLEQYADGIPQIDLRTDFPRPEIPSFSGDTLYLPVEPALHSGILAASRQLRVTAFAFYLAGFSILLAKLTGRERIPICTPVNCRPSAFSGTVGMFVSTVPLLCKPESGKTVSTLVQELLQNAVQSLLHADFSVTDLERATDTHTLHRFQLTYQSEEMIRILLDDHSCELLPIANKTSRSDLSVHILPAGDRVALAVQFSTELFHHDTIRRYVQAYFSILKQMLNVERTVDQLSVFTDTILPSAAHGQNMPLPEGETLASLFEANAMRNADRICMYTATEAITYGQFLDRVHIADQALRRMIGSKKGVVGVLAKRSPEMYIAIYAIIRSGCAYMPISPDDPPERIQSMLSSSGALAILYQDGCSPVSTPIPTLNVSQLIHREEHVGCPPACAALPDDPAYVIFTSGSSGKPKGAVISHQSAINRIQWMESAYPLGQDGVVLQKTPYTFDVSVWEIFWWGLYPGSMAVMPPDTHYLPEKIMDTVWKYRVTHLHFVPAMFSLFLSFLEQHPERAVCLNSVQHIFLSGEQLGAPLIHRFFSLLPHSPVRLHNLYGPTECTVDVSYYDCQQDEAAPVPIGLPIWNTAMYILSPSGQLLPRGSIGELYIGGIGVGIGYIGDPIHTQERFIFSPLHAGMLYRTGDLAYQRQDGVFVFVGRSDSQVKLNGQRIELGEIEAVLSALPSVQTACVILKRIQDQTALIAFYTGSYQPPAELRNSCAKKLPAYMIPQHFICLSEFPLLSNGKTDRAALQCMEIQDDLQSGMLPQTPLQEQICEDFRDVLQTQAVFADSNFLALGGTSLHVISLLSLARYRCLRLEDLLADPTPVGIEAMLLRKEDPETGYLHIIHRPKDSQKALLLFPYAGGQLSAYADLVSQFRQLRPDCAICYCDFLHEPEEYALLCAEITAHFPDSSLHFYGHCVGAACAMQTIALLTEQEPHISCFLTVGGNIPPKKGSLINPWNAVPNSVLKRILEQAGAPVSAMEPDTVKDMLLRFRQDTDFYCRYMVRQCAPLPCKLALVLSDGDPFTKNDSQAEPLWARRVTQVSAIHRIDGGHYFQSSRASQLAQIISEHML